MIQKKYYKLVKVSYEDSGYFYIKNISNTTGVFNITKSGSPQSWDLEYSTDGITWNSYDMTTLPNINVNAVSHLYLKGNTASYLSDYSGYTLHFNADFNIGGNLCSLISKDNFNSLVLTSLNSRWRSLFLNNTHLISAGDLNFGSNTYISGMGNTFYGCTSLTTPPDFSNITSVGGYAFERTFYGCTSLTTPPDFSNIATASGHHIFDSTFYNCTSLVTPPDFDSFDYDSLNYEQVFGMTFYGCTSLATPPQFGALRHIGKQWFSSTFQGCTSLTSGVDFSNITTVNSTESLCSQMYYGCSKLSTAYAPDIETWNNNQFNNWLYNAGTQATGTKTVYKPAALSIPTDSASGVPTGWTTANY